MRLEIRLTAKELPAFLDFNHNYWLASMIYRAIGRADPELSLELHKPGSFKFFTFSRLMVRGKKFRIRGDKMEILTPEVHFFFSSLRNYVCMCLVDGLFKKPEVKIGDVEFTVSGVEVLKEKEIGSSGRFITLSPINVTTSNGSKAIDLYPDSPKFYENLKKNLVKKYVAFYGREPEDSSFEVKAIKVKPVRIKVKDTFHRASLMVFDAKGSKELLEVGYKAGFGERNSMGFGMVKAV